MEQFRYCETCKEKWPVEAITGFKPMDLNQYRVNPKPAGYCPGCGGLCYSEPQPGQKVDVPDELKKIILDMHR